jgi:hypothetical protein
MPRRHEAANLLRSGLALPEIAARLKMRDIDEVIKDLRLLVGEGELKLSDLFFAIPAERRQRLESLIEKTGATTPTTLQKAAQSDGFQWHEIHLYLQLRDAPRVLRGELYERIADIEVALHRLVRKVLVDEFGPSEAGWWRRGVPETLRAACQQARERDPDPVDDPFAYTTLIDLSEIIERNWKIFSLKLPPTAVKDKPNLLRSFRRLNGIRNAVMHPVKGRAWTREDLEFVDEVRRTVLRGSVAR